MSSISRIRTMFRLRRSTPTDPNSVPEASLALPRRIDDPASAAQLTRDLLRHHRENITLAPCRNDRHRLVGRVLLTVGWAQAARLSARPILFGAEACQASTCILVRYCRFRVPGASEGEDWTFSTVAAACSRYGVVVADHVVVTATDFGSAFLGGP
ncbi:MAG: JAB domain-containing protein [Acidimicrobiales bacterium]